MPQDKESPVSTAKFALRLLAGHRKYAAAAVFFFTLKTSPVWLMPVLTARMIDLVHASPGTRLRQLAVLLTVAVVVLVQNIPTHMWTMQCLSRITRGIGRELRIQICRQLQNLTLLYHNRTAVGKIHTKAIRDIENLERVPEVFLGSVYHFVLQVVVAVVAIAWRAPAALLIFAVAVPLAAAIHFCFRNIIHSLYRSLRVSIEGMSNTLSDMLEMIPITRAHGLEKRQLEIVEDKIDSVFRTGRSVDRTIAMYSAISWVSFHLLQIVFLSGCVYACIQGRITIGDVVMFNSFLLILFGQLSGLLATLPVLSAARESLGSIQEVLNAPDREDNDGKLACPKLRGGFELRGVSFRYPETARMALEGLNLAVRPGESVAFVGPSGSGKSTLLSLLLGFVRPVEGQILLDGVDMQNLDLRTYRRNVSVVTQETIFFSGTIAQNVSYGSGEAREGEVLEALRCANALEFVQELPEGIRTRLGADGIKLSGGQQQRLAIARAILRDPKVLILDEATSALDADSERAVQEALDRIMRRRTTFLVAHRISTVRNADRIVVLEEGRITAAGAPGELLQSDNFYSRAVALQQAEAAGG